MYGTILMHTQRGAALRFLIRAVLVCVCGLAWGADSAVQSAEPRVTILAYHRFSDTADDSMTVRMSTFESQLRVLRVHGYHIVPLREVVNWLRDPDATLPPKPVAITVDDGHRSVYEKLLPVILRERLAVTLFIYPSAISNASYAMTWEQLRALEGRPGSWISSRIRSGIPISTSSVDIVRRRISSSSSARNSTSRVNVSSRKPVPMSTCSRGRSVSTTKN